MPRKGARETPDKRELAPVDLLAAVAIAATTLVLTLAPALENLPLRVPFGLFTLLSLSGYTLTTAAFPRRDDLNPLLRAVFCVGLGAVALLPVDLGNGTSWGIRLNPVMISISAFIAVSAIIAYLRQMRLPAEERSGGEVSRYLISLKDVLVSGHPLLFVLLIALGELLLFWGHMEAAMVVHGINLIGLVLLTAFMEDRIYQALMLLPLFRLLNVAMPVFFELTLYSYALVYIPMFIPAYLIIKEKRLSYEKMGLTTAGFLTYLPTAVALGLLMGWGEYQVLHPQMLTPGQDLMSLVKLSLIMIFFVGLIEEFVFRSVLQTVLVDRMGLVKGILGASLLFGMMHSGYGMFSELIFVFFAGIVFGIFFLKTNSLPLVALSHGVTNISLFMVVPVLSGSLIVLAAAACGLFMISALGTMLSRRRRSWDVN